MTVCNRYPKELTHYEKQLKKRFFVKLKENVWENKTKWKLILKAQSNYHRKLILSSFRAWSCFTMYKRQKKEKLESSDEYYVRRMKSKALLALKRRIEHRLALKKKLYTIRNFKMKKRAWIYWRNYVKKSKRSKEIYVLTEKMREIYLVRNCINAWFVKHIEKNFNEMMYLKAVAHHNFGLKRRCFVDWMNYRNQKNIKRQLISHLLTQLELKLKERVFARLMQYTQHKKLYEKHVNCVKLFYETYVVKSVIDKWYVKYEDLVESRNRAKHDLAVRFYDESLLRRSFRKMKLWSEDEKSRKDTFILFLNIKIKSYIDLWRKFHREKLLSSSLEEKAQKWRNHQLKLIYLTKMIQLFDDKRRENERIENFIKFCDARLLSEYFHKLKQFILIRKRKTRKFQAAQHHYDTKITRKSFRFLQTYTARQIRKSSIFSYYNSRLLSTSFNKLRSYSRIRLIHRDFINKFQERCRLLTLRRAFSVLNDKTKKNRLKYLIAREVGDRNTKKRAFEQLKIFHEIKAQKKMILNNGRVKLQDVIVRGMITQWWKKSQIRTSFKQELNKVKTNREKRQVSSYLRKWLQLIVKFGALRENVKTYHEVYAGIIVEHYLLKMVFVWNGRRMVKDKLDLALRAEKRFLTRRYYNRWVTYISWKKEKLRECSERIILQMKFDKNRRRCSKAKLRRKQPMIPVYLQEELLPLYEDRFLINGTYDASSLVGDNLTVIY